MFIFPRSNFNIIFTVTQVYKKGECIGSGRILSRNPSLSRMPSTILQIMKHLQTRDYTNQRTVSNCLSEPVSLVVRVIVCCCSVLFFFVKTRYSLQFFASSLEDPNLSRKIISCDEVWIFQCANKQNSKV
jgi:hypothetical protein